MKDELSEAIHSLQGNDEASAQQALRTIASLVLQDPTECSVELSKAVQAEWAAGALRTPRLLTLLGLTRVPVPDCVSVCLDLLHALVAADTRPPTDAALGAAAIIARTKPLALLPDVTMLETDLAAASLIDHDIAIALMLLLSITSQFLHELPDHPVTDMARRLWCDCAAFDLMTLSDFAALHVRKSGADDPLLGLMVDLVERVPATADQKRYACEAMQSAGISAFANEQLQTAWRAIRVAPAPDPAAGEPATVADPRPPPPEPRVDEWLAAFSEGDQDGIEIARAGIDQMFEHPPVALIWWVAVTVDALPPWRRRSDIDWALIQLSRAVREPGSSMRSMVPPSLLRRWLDTPQLLNPTGLKIALDLLSRQQPGVVVRRYLHRAVAASSEPYPEITMGEMWRALTVADPSAVLWVASRWIEAGFGESALLKLLIDLLIERTREQPTLIDELASALTPAEVIEIARKLLKALRDPPREDQQP